MGNARRPRKDEEPGASGSGEASNAELSDRASLCPQRQAALGVTALSGAPVTCLSPGWDLARDGRWSQRPDWATALGKQVRAENKA